MSNIKNKTFSFIVKISYYPRNFINSILYLFLKNKNDWSIFEKYFNKEILIVGNGPSLNKTPLDQIDMVSIGMNKINMLFDKTTWRPNIIVCVNGLVIKQNKDFFNTTQIPVILPVSSLYLGIKKRSNIFFVKRNNNINFQDDIRKGIGIGSTVTYTAMQIAAFIKAQSINIVGVDHSFKVEGNKNEIKKLDKTDENHFDPNYFKGQYWGLPDLDGSEKAYSLAKEYFESKNIRITDYTINGKLNIFKKDEIEKLLSTKK